MFPKGTVPEKPDKKETTIYVVGERDVQVALTRAGKTEVKRAVICACAVVLTTLILVAGTLGAIAVWLSFADHHGYPHDHSHGHGSLLTGGSGTSPAGGKIDDGGLWPLGGGGGGGQTGVTESITDMPGASTRDGDILIDGNERPRPTEASGRQTAAPTAPSSVGDPFDSSWESYPAPFSHFSETDPEPEESSDYEVLPSDPSYDSDAGSGSGDRPDQEEDGDEVEEDYREIPYKSSGVSYYYSSLFPEESYDSEYEPGSVDDEDEDWDWDDVSGSGSGDTETSGDNLDHGFQDTFTTDDEKRPVLKTPQEFTMVRYPVPVTNYRTLCISDTCTICYMKGQQRVEVIETDLQMQPKKLTVLRKTDGTKVFTLIRDERQGYRAILLEGSGLCLLTRLEDTANLDLTYNSASPITERLRVTLPVELPEPLLLQIGGPIMEACSQVPVFWAQQIGGGAGGGGGPTAGGDGATFLPRLRRSGGSPPSRGQSPPSRGGELTLADGIHFQCCWCAEADDPCPCACGRF